MELKRILIAGIIVGILFLFLDMLMAISTMPILSKYASLPIWKNPPNITAGMVFDLFNGLILVFVYSLLFSAIPGKGWKKGLNYGMIVGLFRVVMSSFSSIVMYSIPDEVVITNLIAGFIEIAVLGILVALVFERIK